MTDTPHAPGTEAVAELQAHLHRVYGLSDQNTPDIRPLSLIHI